LLVSANLDRAKNRLEQRIFCLRMSATDIACDYELQHHFSLSFVSFDNPHEISFY